MPSPLNRADHHMFSSEVSPEISVTERVLLQRESPSWSALGCCNKTLHTNGFNNRHLFLTALEAGSWRPRCQRGHALVRALLLTCRWLTPWGQLSCET